MRRGVYVTDVPEDVTDPNELIELFKTYGKVTTARIIMKECGKDENGNKIMKSKGQAFILFETQVGAFRAVDASPLKFKDNDLVINFYKSKKDLENDKKKKEVIKENAPNPMDALLKQMNAVM